MIWADRIAVFWTLLVVLFVCFLQQPGGFVNSLQPANIWGGWGELLMKLCFFPWVILRVLDALAGGPDRRRGVIKVYPNR